MKLNRTIMSAASLAGVLTVAVGGSAFAAGVDTNSASTSTYVAVGSDTTDDVVAALSTALTDSSGNPYISSYSAAAADGSTTLTIPARSYGTANTSCTFTRPNGSGAGINALAAGILGIAAPGQTSGTATNCVQIARSSSSSAPSGTYAVPTNSLTYIPFGVDSVTYATTSSSVFAHNLNLDTLKAIYRANGTPGTSQCGGALAKWQPLIPQSGSGTRRFWATVLGITDGTIDTTKSSTTATDNTWGSCVRDIIGSSPSATTGTAIQEHDGRVLTNANQIVPFSTAQYIAQGSSVISDTRGKAVLNAIDFDNGSGATSVSPFVLQANFTGANGNTAARQVYNVVETARLNSDSRLSGLLSGSSSTLCSSTTARAIIQRFGFDLSSSCGVGVLKP